MNFKHPASTTSCLLLLCCAGAQENQIKRQAQFAGINAKFGTTYSLQDGFNFAVRGGKYTVDPFDDYTRGTVPDADTKLVVFEVAFKNARSSDSYLNTEGLFTVVDDKQNTYPFQGISLESGGNNGFAPTLKPGQGFGQAALHDPLRLVFKVPSQAVLTELIVNAGRLYTNERVMRYLLSPPSNPPKAGANVLTGLPEDVHDSGDNTGAVALKVGAAKLGEYVPTGAGAMKVEEVSSPDGLTCDGKSAPAGTRFVVVKFSTKQLLTNQASLFEIYGADFVPYRIVDADGDQFKKIGVKKLSSDADLLDRKLDKGDEIEFRMFFQVPKDDKLKKLIFGWNNSRLWALDLASSP